jgi:hypothetical protein
MQTLKSFSLLLTAGVTLCSTAALAQTANPDSFPLQTGNSWLFRSANDSNSGAENFYRSISVGAKETVGGREYFNVRYFERAVLLRSEPDGSILALDRASGVEQPWLEFGLPEGATFESHIDQCTNTGRIESRTSAVATPVAQFRDAVRISFQGQCSDAGTLEQSYVANVGPVSHTQANFAGPRKYDLVYYRTGSSNMTSQEMSFTVALDARVYRIGGTMGVRLTARSTDPQPVNLHFPTGQFYELKIFDQNGSLVYTWSAGRSFPLIIRDEQFGPGELSYGFSVPLNGIGLPPGRYKAQAYITTAPVMFLGEAPFEIAEMLP